MTDPWGLALAARKVTVSTAGHIEGIKALRLSSINMSLAISLHTANPIKRSQLMPINRKNPLDKLIEEVKRYSETTHKKVFIQYTLIHKVNDTIEDAKNLVEILKGINVKINLIPWNPIPNSQFKGPDNHNIKLFQSFLLSNGVRATVRYSKGWDIDAACGQLVQQKT